MLKPAGVRCFYRYLFKENPHLSLKKKKKEIHSTWMGQVVLSKNFDQKLWWFFKADPNHCGWKDEVKSIWRFFMPPAFLLVGNARRGAFSFPMWLFPLFLIILRVLGEKGIAVCDCETSLPFRKQCYMSRMVICAKRWYYYAFCVFPPLA